MEKRYFYTDPLAAAWMAKHFGMRFVFIRDDGWRQSVKSWQSIQRHERTYFIRNRSLHLLEPQRGDLVFYDNLHGGEAWDEFRCLITPDDERYPYVGTGEALMLMDSGEHPYRKELRRIIQRNGLAFHWPESGGA